MGSLRRHALIAALLAAAAGDAGAQPVERIAMSYVVPAGCPSEAEFVARLRERAPVVQIESGAQRTFDIGIEPLATGLRGTLVIRSTTGALVREVEGETCEDTVAALVVVAALAIEVSAAEPAPPVPPPASLPPPPPRPSPAPPLPRDRWLAVGTGLGVYQGLAPDAMFGARLFVAVGRPHGPRVRVALTRTEEGRASVAEGTSTFRWTAVRIDARPLPWSRGPFFVSPAIGLTAGVLAGRGDDVGMPGGGSRPWVAPELSLALGVHAGRFAVELEGIAAVPLVRDRFFIAPATTVHETPWVASGVGLTLAVEVL